MLLKSNLNNLNNLVKKENVLMSLEERYCYAQDSTNSRLEHKLPDAVVFVETIEEVQKVLKFANKNKIPVICRGAGTNMVGACVCDFGGIVLNFSRMNKILDFNSVNMTMKVQPGVVLNDIKNLAETENLFYPPDPSNFRVSTIGGSIAQSSGGAKSFKYGTTKDYLLNLKVVLADGTLMTLGANTIKDAVGYHLNQLIVGSEGTLAVVVEAELKLIPKPEETRVVTAYFDEIDEATSAVTNILRTNVFPATIDFMDNNSISTVEKFYPCNLDVTKNAMLLIELDGFASSMEIQQERVEVALNKANASKIEVKISKEEQEAVWTARRASFAATAKLAPDVVSDDIIVPRDKLAAMVKGANEICKKYGLAVCIVGHVGDGNIHPQVALNLENDDEFKNYIKAKTEMYELATSLGGTISAEHGVGSEKISYIKQTVDEKALGYMKKIKKLFDPNNIMNTGKIFKLN